MNIEVTKATAEEFPFFLWSADKILELVAEIERLQQLKVCDVCYTSSWTPCPPNTLDCVPDNIGGWMVCGYCRLVADNVNLREACQLVLDECQDVLYTARLEQVTKAIKEALKR